MNTPFQNLTGYNSNKFVKVDHVFIPGEGSFYETRELAISNYGKTGNEIGFHIVEFLHEGVIVFKGAQINVFD